jgi:hypothetical protein
MHQHAPPFLPPVPQSNGVPQPAQVRRRCGNVVWPGTGIIATLSEVIAGKINHAEVAALRQREIATGARFLAIPSIARRRGHRHIQCLS